MQRGKLFDNIQIIGSKTTLSKFSVEKLTSKIVNYGCFLIIYFFSIKDLSGIFERFHHFTFPVYYISVGIILLLFSIYVNNATRMRLHIYCNL